MNRTGPVSHCALDAVPEWLSIVEVLVVEAASEP
jgi:hypothetical protein